MTQLRHLDGYLCLWDPRVPSVLLRDHDLALWPWRARHTSSCLACAILIQFSACSIQPVGSQILSGLNIAGHNWNLWKGPNSNWEVFSFVSANGDITDFNADLKDFFDYLVQNQGVAGTQVSFRLEACTHLYCLLIKASPVRPGDSDGYRAFHGQREPVDREFQCCP